MKLLAVPLFAVALVTCERPDVDIPGRVRPGRVGWLRTAKGRIPIEDVLDPNTTNARARAFRETYGVDSLTAEAMDDVGRSERRIDASNGP